jgi:hypothetical protein
MQRVKSPTAQIGQSTKHVPQRMCIACRHTDAKKALIRLVRTDDSHVEIDQTGKRRGRGAYLCHNPRCWETALKRRGLERALRLERLHPDDRATLEQFVQHLEGTMSD